MKRIKLQCQASQIYLLKLLNILTLCKIGKNQGGAELFEAQLSSRWVLKIKMKMKNMHLVPRYQPKYAKIHYTTILGRYLGVELSAFQVAVRFFWSTLQTVILIAKFSSRRLVQPSSAERKFALILVVTATHPGGKY